MCHRIVCADGDAVASLAAAAQPAATAAAEHVRTSLVNAPHHPCCVAGSKAIRLLQNSPGANTSSSSSSTAAGGAADIAGTRGGPLTARYDHIARRLQAMESGNGSSSGSGHAAAGNSSNSSNGSAAGQPQLASEQVCVLRIIL
jgi:hypothetical protein